MKIGKKRMLSEMSNLYSSDSSLSSPHPNEEIALPSIIEYKDDHIIEEKMPLLKDVLTQVKKPNISQEDLK